MHSYMPILLEIAEKMNAGVEIEDILPAIVQVAKDYMGVKRVSIFLKEDDKLSLKAFAGFNPELPVTVAQGEGITGRVFSDGKVYIANHIKTSSGYDSSYTATSFLSLPVKLHSEIIGVLNLTDKDDDFFNDSDVITAEYIASQCSLAVERYRLYHSMRSSERLQTLGMMSASIAHDIRNMLGIVEVYLSFMEDSPGIDTTKEYFSAIRTEIDRVQGLTEDMMEYSKKQIALNYVDFDLNSICLDVEKQLNMALKLTRVRIKADVKGSIKVHADKDRLFRAVFNIANNAVQAIPESKDGLILIRTRDLGADASIFIIDNGKGIPNKIIKNIFDPFITSGKPKGTGLGLAIVKEVVQAHGGSIKVRSHEGHYTAFRIVIPKEGKI